MGFDSLNGPIYDVEKILDHKKGANGKTLYLVKWEVCFCLYFWRLSTNCSKRSLVFIVMIAVYRLTQNQGL